MKKILGLKKKLGMCYILLCFMSYFVLDWILRKTYIVLGDVELYHKIPLFFVLGWCFILCGIIYILPRMWKKVFIIVSTLSFNILTLVHGAYINVFDKFFSFSDLSLLKEGAGFADASYIDIRKRIVLTVIFSIMLMVVSVCIIPKEEKRKKTIIVGGVLFLVGIGSVGFAKASFPAGEDATTWAGSQNIKNVYEDFVDTKRCLILSGLYEYTFRDLWEIMNPFEAIQYEEQVEKLDAYFEKEIAEKEVNEKTGIFKDKKFNPGPVGKYRYMDVDRTEYAPSIWVEKEGIDFVNHYSVGFATGKTFNTEFIVNTGYVPQTKGQAPSYIYSKNYYPNSLANLFEKKGYTANSYHSASGSIYNRAKVHEVFGYEKYHNWEDMKMEDYTMDSQMLNNFESMISTEKFFDFIITYSGHGPFSMDNEACRMHIEEVKAENNDTDETYLYGLAQAKETDLLIGKLIDKLEENHLIDNTVLVFYTDHYAYSTIDKEKELELKGTTDPNMLQNTPFFIWSKDIEVEEIEKVTSTADILPTLANMFELECEYQYWVGKDIFDNKDRGYAMFSDFTWYDGSMYYNNQYNGEITDEIIETTKEVEEKIKMSWDVLECNYFKQSQKK